VNGALVGVLAVSFVMVAAAALTVAGVVVAWLTDDERRWAS
jgi:hypothetical protein